LSDLVSTIFDSVHVSRSSLVREGNGGAGDMDAGVPTDLQAEPRAMKDALAAGADAVMRCAIPGATQASLENSLGAFMISAKPPRRPVAPTRRTVEPHSPLIWPVQIDSQPKGNAPHGGAF
jgi:hypothetical protein